MENHGSGEGYSREFECENVAVTKLSCEVNVEFVKDGSLESVVRCGRWLIGSQPNSVIKRTHVTAHAT